MPSQTLQAHGFLLYPNPRNLHRIVFEHHVFVPYPYAIIDIPAMDLVGKTSVYAACRETDRKMGQVVTFELLEDVARFEKALYALKRRQATSHTTRNAMQDGSQIFIPDSFIALFQGRQQRLRQPLTEIAQRYELCEDLAQMLVEQAQILYHQSAPSESAILQTMYAGLQAEGAGVSPEEARWVVLRLAELLEWRAPELLLPSPPEDDAV